MTEKDVSIVGCICRYYGRSKPYKKSLTHHMQFLTSEQAMADYAELIWELKNELQAENSPVIGFGGSYGMQDPILLWLGPYQLLKSRASM